MSITYRKGTIDDSHAIFQVFVRTLMDYSERMNVMAITGGNDPQILESLWKLRRPMFEYLAIDAAQFWVAENDGEIIAYARSIEHDGMQELTEFFVSPHQQSTGWDGSCCHVRFRNPARASAQLLLPWMSVHYIVI